MRWALLAVALLWNGEALADFVIEGSGARGTSGGGDLRLGGGAAGPSGVLVRPAVGFGRDMPLELAVRQIVPEELRITFLGEMDRKAKVAWQGGDPWQDVLRAVTGRLGLEFYVDMGEVWIRKASGGARGTERAETIPDVGPVAQVTAASVTTWTVEAGKTLRTTVEEWAGRAGWRVSWQTERDYRIEADAVLTGDFEEAGMRLLKAFEAGDFRLGAVFYRGNKVVVVSVLGDSRD